MMEQFQNIEYELVEIESIEDLGIFEEEVYDVGMEDSPHTFFATDILVHNSIFCSSLPLIKKLYPETDLTSDTQMTEKSVIIAGQVQEYINKMYNPYAERFHNIKQHRFDIKQEIVSKAAFWVAKKRYAQLMLYKEGISINKLSVTGIDTVRADFPSAFKTFFINILNDILKEKTNAEVNVRVQDFKNELENFKLNEIMFPTGVKDVSKHDSAYRDKFRMQKGAPIHVKSSLYYNDLLNHHGLEDSRIANGDKVKWCYLKTNPYNMPTLAVKEITKSAEIFEFIEKYIDRDKMFDSKIKNKLDDFYLAMKWEYNRQNVNKFFNF